MVLVAAKCWREGDILVCTTQFLPAKDSAMMSSPWVNSDLMHNQLEPNVSSLELHTVDGRNPANQLTSSFSHYLQGFYLFRVVIAGFLNHQQNDFDVWDPSSSSQTDVGETTHLFFRHQHKTDAPRRDLGKFFPQKNSR